MTDEEIIDVLYTVSDFFHRSYKYAFEARNSYSKKIYEISIDDIRRVYKTPGLLYRCLPEICDKDLPEDFIEELIDFMKSSNDLFNLREFLYRVSFMNISFDFVKKHLFELRYDELSKNEYFNDEILEFIKLHKDLV
jgi:hypothetical protein